LVYDKSTKCRQWKQARALTPEDHLVLPKNTAQMAGVVSEGMAEIIAWYTCEGSVNGNAVSFSLNGNNPSEIAHVKQLLLSEGYPSKWYGKGSSGSLTVNSAALADVLSSWCGCGALNKRIPFDLIRGHEQAFFDAMIQGDGCVVRAPDAAGAGDVKRYAFASISKSLALDMQALAGTLGKRAGITIKPGGPSVILGRTVTCHKTYMVQITTGFDSANARHRNDAFPTKLGIAYRVRSVDLFHYNGMVHNISVKEDESYVAEGRAVHNCEFSAASSRFISEEIYNGACYEALNLPSDFHEAGRVVEYGGIDVARRRDRTAFTKIAKYGQVTWQIPALAPLFDDEPSDAYTHVNQKMAWDQQEEWVDERIQSCATVAVDGTGFGDQFAERMENRWPGRVDNVKFNNKSKATLATGLRLALERKKLRVWKDDVELRREVLSMRRETTDAGNITYMTPTKDGGHGDRAWSLALAEYASGGAAAADIGAGTGFSVTVRERTPDRDYLRPPRGGLYGRTRRTG